MPSKTVQPPPRLLLGATLLFWGAMSGNSALALILALIIESPNWIRSRWNFNDQACSRAWYLCIILTVFAMIPIWLEGNRYTTLTRLLTWLPVLLFPLQFLQSFGFQKQLKLNNFYLFSQSYINRNTELGIKQSIVCFNFGNVYFIASIIASSLGPYAQGRTFFIGLIMLASWRMLANMRSRFLAMITILMLAAAIGLTGQIGMTALYHWVTNRGMNFDGIPDTDPTLKMTHIGSLGAIKQSSEMVWRITPKAGQMPPRLLRTASYNRYKGVNWKIQYPAEMSDNEESYRPLDSTDLAVDNSYYMLRENMIRKDIIKPLSEFEIRGAAMTGYSLPLPGNTSTLNNFVLDGVEINPVGNVRISPIKSIIQGNVRWNDDLTTEAPPFPKEDLLIDDYEMEGIHEVTDALGLKQLATTTEKIKRIREFFDTEFHYTRYLTIGRAFSSRKRPTAIETFLTTNKNGHCEYFATAATLLLRAADVPTRYTIGFSVIEKNTNNDEWIIRGTHAHAWTRVWNKELQRWVDFDPTPSGWLIEETRGYSRMQSFYDTYQRIKEDFFLWRNEASNRIAVNIVMWILGTAFVLYITFRLKKSRVVVDSKKSRCDLGKPAIKTPLHDLEKVALKILGSRSPGETFVAWLMKLKAHNISETELKQACALHQQLRFDPSPPGTSSDLQLLQISQKLTRQLNKL
jgi:hypothetical protein